MSHMQPAAVRDESRWDMAQEEPGTVNHVWWTIIDTRNKFVRARAFGRDFAQSLVDGLNGATYADATAVGLDPEVAQALVDEIEGSAPRNCGHQNTGDGSAVSTCPQCMTWAQAQSDSMAVRKHLGLS